MKSVFSTLPREAKNRLSAVLVLLTAMVAGRSVWPAPHTRAAQSAAGAAVMAIYVATNGNDAWSGKLAEPNAARSDGPFATLVRARDAIRVLKGGHAPPTPITVLVRGGKYFFSEKLILSGQDSGSQDFPVTYKAYPGEKPILSGGLPITDWRRYQGKILQARVPLARGRIWKYRQLFLNGQRQVRARYPKFDAKNPLYGGWTFVDAAPVENDLNELGGTSFKYKAGVFPHHWAKPTEGEVMGFPDEWNSDYFPIARVDERNSVLYLTRQPRDLYPEPWFGEATNFSRGDRFRVENMLEELNQPGEWCLDSEAGVLYFWPPSGAIHSGDEIVFPVLDTLIDVEGASWIDLSGFTFTETTGGDDTHHLWVDGAGPMYARQGWEYAGDTLHMEKAEHCIIERNHFDAVGGNAIYLERYNAHNIIRRNEIGYAGTNGICLLGNYFPVGSMVAMQHGKQPLPMFNEIVDNDIHHVGVFNKYVAGIYLGVSDGNEIAHNRITDVPHHGICLGVNGFGRNIVEYNELRHVATEIAETAAINAWMDQPHSDERVGHIIRYNLIVDVLGVSTDPNGRFIMPDGSANGIYLDNNASNDVIYGNVIVRASASGIYLHGGKNNIIENNIVVDSGRASNRPANPACWEPLGQVGYTDNIRGENFVGNRFSHNILYYSAGKPPAPIYSYCAYDPGLIDWYTRQDPRLAIGESDHNVIFRADGGEYWVLEGAGSLVDGKPSNEPIQHLSLADWRRMGFEQHSISADPEFEDPAHDDYRLKSTSPAFGLGFAPIEMSRIGIRPAD